VSQPEPSIPPIHIDGVWMPEAASTIAEQTDYTFWATYWISVVFFVLVVGPMVYFAFAYKRKSETERTSPIDHSTKLEVAWTILPTVLLMYLFAISIKGYANTQVAPDGAYEIKVTAQMFSWSFQYPDGTVSGELAVPKDRPVKMIMSSQDVIHSFFISEFRVKQDVVPGLYTTLWFEATKTMETALQCTEYCGERHSGMLTKVTVLEQKDFDTWINNGGTMTKLPPVEWGAKLYTSRGCNNCHSIDGTRIQGPTFKGLWAKGTENLEGGATQKIDENYIKESILDPSAQIVAGYPNVMSPYAGQLREEDLDALIAWMKTLN
jgi:cytochrome c oxidase subunit 2